jgi:hypothetical protein
VGTPTPSRRAWPADNVERRAVAKLIPSARNARVHSAKQVGQIAGSIREFGWTVPVLIDEQDNIIAGHGRVLAAPLLSIDEVPVIVARGWSDAQKRAYALADNQIALGATWNKALLRIELDDLRRQAIDIELLGFAAGDAGTTIGIVGDELPPGLQMEPPREYALVMCKDAAEWERLKVALNLTPVRRGGYKKGSPFDDIGTQRVVHAADVLALIEGGNNMSFFEWFDRTADSTADHHTVMVKKGDSLWKIAEAITGDGARWQELADANPDKTWSQDYVIQPGEELKVPRSWGD